MTSEIWIIGITGALVLASLIAGLAYVARRDPKVDPLHDLIVRYVLATGSVVAVVTRFNERLGLWDGTVVVNGDDERYEAPYERTRDDARDKCIRWLEQELTAEERRRDHA